MDGLCALPGETEWVEFKVNDKTPDAIGEYISALSNAAALLDKDAAYMVWGVEDLSHRVVGTAFRPRREKVGAQELESWLCVHLEPTVEFRFHELTVEGLPVVILDIRPCSHTPTRWKESAYIRVGTYKKKLKDFPEKERALWFKLSKAPFERGTAARDLLADEVLKLLDYDAYYRLTEQNLPATKKGILDRLVQEKIVSTEVSNRYTISNLGALLFARKLAAFDSLGRKAVRVIDYGSISRVLGGREYVSETGYAAGFESLAAYVNSRLPANEQIGQALRVAIPIYPEIAIRELTANAIIHQDLTVTGDSPLIEIFSDRMEITNSGLPLIDTLRFIDEPPQSRNETLAGFMRRIKICEERGSGVDKVISSIEAYQLPAPEFTVTQRHTKVIMYAPRPFRKMSSKDRVRACYQHACLMHVTNQQMTNATLRKRFSVGDADYPIVSLVIANTLKEKLVKPADPENRSKRHARYVPFWA